MNFNSASFKSLGSEDQAEVRAKHAATAKSKALKKAKDKFKIVRKPGYRYSLEAND